MCIRNWTGVCRSMSAAIILAAVLLAGCESKRQRPGFHPANVASGQLLPGKQYLVGGGLNVAWKAPEAGTVFLVEKRTGKLVETRSLEEGGTFSFVVDSTVRAQELGEILGINLAKTQFLLYFEPAGEEPPMEQARAMGRQGER
jgi:hypothetical protein